jgi:hypothetical protein
LREEREFAEAVQACGLVVQSIHDEQRVAWCIAGLLGAVEPGAAAVTDATDPDDLSISISSTRGAAAEAALILAERVLKRGDVLDPLLHSSLRRAARDAHPSIRAMVLRNLPRIIQLNGALGWPLFWRAMGESPRPWRMANNCLYYNYHRHFDLVEPALIEARADPGEHAQKVWGRIGALAAFDNHPPFGEFLAQLGDAMSPMAWTGAVSVFVANLATPQWAAVCADGLAAAFADPNGQAAASTKFVRMFGVETCAPARIPLSLLHTYMQTRGDEGLAGGRDVQGAGQWLQHVARRDPDYALAAAEIFLTAEVVGGLHPWNADPFAALLTELFREAEEREPSDDGAFLERVIGLQDHLLGAHPEMLQDWLTSAERP